MNFITYLNQNQQLKSVSFVSDISDPLYNYRTEKIINEPFFVTGVFLNGNKQTAVFCDSHIQTAVLNDNNFDGAFVNDSHYYQAGYFRFKVVQSQPLNLYGAVMPVVITKKNQFGIFDPFPIDATVKTLKISVVNGMVSYNVEHYIDSDDGLFKSLEYYHDYSFQNNIPQLSTYGKRTFNIDDIYIDFVDFPQYSTEVNITVYPRYNAVIVDSNLQGNVALVDDNHNKTSTKLIKFVESAGWNPFTIAVNWKSLPSYLGA